MFDFQTHQRLLNLKETKVSRVIHNLPLAQNTSKYQSKSNPWSTLCVWSSLFDEIYSKFLFKVLIICKIWESRKLYSCQSLSGKPVFISILIWQSCRRMLSLQFGYWEKGELIDLWSSSTVYHYSHVSPIKYHVICLSARLSFRCILDKECNAKVLNWNFHF